MTDLLTFDYHESAVRIIERDGAPWFVAADVAAILGYDHAPHMTRALDDDEKGVHNADTLGGNQQLTIISESGLYNAIFKSRRAEARAFRRWVTGTVLPTLRRTGSFAMPICPTALCILPDVDMTRFAGALSAVSLMRKMRGNHAALQLWAHFGLPLPAAAIDADNALAVRVVHWADGKERFTTDDAAAALSINGDNAHTRRAIGDALLAAGFQKKRGRIKGGLAYLWSKAA